MSQTVTDEVARLKALLTTYGGDRSSPPIVAINGLLAVSERLDEQQAALTTLIRDFSGDSIARQFRAEASKAWRAVMPNVKRDMMWSRRLAVARDIVLMACGFAVVLLIWIQPSINIGQVAPQCADPSNLTRQDGGIFCTMRVWVKPPIKGKE